MPTYHEYPVEVRWSGGREGHGTITPEASKTELQVAVPTEFQGPGGATNPEELLTSAITGCYSITFGIVAANRKLPVSRIEVSATGTVEQNGAAFAYKSIVISPKIFLAAGSTPEQVATTKDMAHKTDQYCIVTNAVRDKVAVTVEPEVVVEGA